MAVLISLYGTCFGFDSSLSRGLCPGEGTPAAEVSVDSSLACGQAEWFHQWKTQSGRVWLQAGRDRRGEYVLRFEDSCFAISAGGGRVRLRAEAAELASARHDLINTVIPMLLNLQGKEVLHASSVLSRTGEAVAFLGNGGAGKSTAAAGMIRAGYQLLSDDATPLLPQANAIYTASGAAEMNLWAGPRRLLGLDQDRLEEGKCLVSLGKSQHREGRFPLARIYILQASPQASCSSIMAIAGAQALIELVRAAHRMDLRDGAMLQRQFDVLRRVAEMAPARRLLYPEGCPDPEAWAELVEADLRNQRQSPACQLPAAEMQR